MNCPACDSYDAYIGLLWVHCRNAECRYYDRAYDEKKTREDLKGLIEVPDERPEDRLRRVRDLWYPKGPV